MDKRTCLDGAKGHVLVTRPATNDFFESERFREIADAAPVGLWRIDASFEHDWVNKHWLDYTGGSLEEEVAFAWVDKVHPDDRERVVEEFDRAFEAREATTVEFRLRGRDGSYRWFRDSGAPYHCYGKFAGFVGSCIDITERKQAEAQRREIEEDLVARFAAEATSLLAAAVVHEVTQPLMAITSYAGVLERIIGARGDIPPELAAAASSIRQAALRAHEIVRNCRHLFGGGTAEQELAELAEVLRSAEPHIFPHLAAAGLSIDWDLPPGLSVNVKRTQIEQVLINLAINGMEAMKGRQGASIAISAARWGQAGIVSVADQGPGVPAALREKLFDAAASNKPDGKGMGLHICRLIVSAHGGRIWVDDNPGGGAVFRFSIPLDFGDEV